MGNLDRYGGAESWDRYCEERERAYQARIAGATCADCAHCHVFDSGRPAARRAIDRMLDLADVQPKDASHSLAAIVGNMREQVADACEVWVCDLDAPLELMEMMPGTTPADVECEEFEQAF